MKIRKLITASFMLIVLAQSAAAAEVFAGLSLRIRDESAPAGSIVQLKIDVTEPKPISTARGTVKPRGVTNVQGIALMNRNQDTYGAAIVDDGGISFAIHSPSSLFGMAGDYPILTIAGTVEHAANGTTWPLTLEPGALRFITPDGSEYPLEIQNGTLTVANVVSIGNVSPGSAIVPAGGVVHISGTNFVPGTRLQLGEASVASTRYIDSQHIDVVLAAAATMRGMRIRAKNPDNSESTYFSYQRTQPATPSRDSMLSKVVPLFAPLTYTNATVSLPRPLFSRRRAAGPARGSGASAGSAVTAVALQNQGAAEVPVTIELLDGRGDVYAVNTLTIGPNQYVVRAIDELFGTVSPPSAFRVTSAVPIEVLGLAADHAGNSITPYPPI